MIQSMRQKGNCWDCTDRSCFGTLKIGHVHQVCYPTRDAARHRTRSPTSTATTIVRGSILPSVISLSNRQSAKPLNSMSAISREGYHELTNARGPQFKVALGRISLTVNDSDRKLSQRRVGLPFFLKCGVEELFCPAYAQLTGPSLQTAVA